MIALGFAEEEAQRISDGFVEDDRTGMIVLAGLYDPEIPNSQNESYIAKVHELTAIQEKLHQQGTSGFGQLAKTLAQMGEDPEEIIEKYRQEAASQGNDLPTPSASN